MKGLMVPDTWDELLQTAQSLQGSNFQYAGSSGGYGICLDLGPMCKSNFYAMAIAASFLQYKGLSQVMLRSSWELQAMVNTLLALKQYLRVSSCPEFIIVILVTFFGLYQDLNCILCLT